MPLYPLCEERQDDFLDIRIETPHVLELRQGRRNVDRGRSRPWRRRRRLERWRLPTGDGESGAVTDASSTDGRLEHAESALRLADHLVADTAGYVQFLEELVEPEARSEFVDVRQRL